MKAAGISTWATGSVISLTQSLTARIWNLNRIPAWNKILSGKDEATECNHIDHLLYRLYGTGANGYQFPVAPVDQRGYCAFTIDNLDNIYVLNSQNQVKKYNANGDSVAIFNDIRKYGRASLIDVSNPLKVLLYYRDFATVVMLDRFLNPVNTVDLRKENIFQAKTIAQSYDNKIWVYDEVENKLKKIGEDGKLIQETPDFRLLLDQSVNPVKISDENQYVYLYDSTKGFMSLIISVP